MHTIDNFRIVSRLGTQKKRKFNEVFLVEHLSEEIRGVLKTVVKTPENHHLLPLIRQEAEISFSRNGLPHTLAFEENEREILLVRNFIPGIPLHEYWKKVPKTERTSFLIELLEDLHPLFEEMHSQGIIHADIKPSNILVHPAEKGIETGLIDFGMAIRKGTPLPRKTLFALGYSAPELILNQLQLAGPETDVFSLGISIWQLFTGKLPLTHANPGIMTNLQITHPLPDSRDIPPEWKPVLAKMCFKNSFRVPPNQMDPAEMRQCLTDAMQQRFQTLQEVAASLERRPVRSFLERLKDLFSVSHVKRKQ